MQSDVKPCPICGRPSDPAMWTKAIGTGACVITKVKPGIIRLQNQQQRLEGDPKPTLPAVSVTLQGPEHSLCEATILDGAWLYATGNPKRNGGSIQIYHSHGFIDIDLSPEQVADLKKAFDVAREKLQRRKEWS